MKYSGKDVERVLEMYRSTMFSTREVAARCGVGRQSAADWVKAAGISRAANDSRTRPEATRRHAVDLYNKGLPGAKVASILGVPHGTVKNWVRNAGVARSKSAARSIDCRVKHSNEIVMRLGAMREGGATLSEISAELGVPIGSVTYLFKRYGRLTKQLSRRFYKLDKRSTPHVVAA